MIVWQETQAVLIVAWFLNPIMLMKVLDGENLLVLCMIKDPKRVGSNIKPLLEHGNLTTWISMTKVSPGGFFTSLNESNKDRTLVKVFGIIGLWLIG